MMNKNVVKELFGEKAIVGKTMLFLRSMSSIDVKTGIRPEQSKSATGELMPYPKTGKNIICRTFVGGALITTSDLFANRNEYGDSWDQLWDCDIIIIPKKKFSTDSFMGVPTSECLKGNYADFQKNKWQPEDKKDMVGYEGFYDVENKDKDAYEEEIMRDF